MNRSCGARWLSLLRRATSAALSAAWCAAMPPGLHWLRRCLCRSCSRSAVREPLRIPWLAPLPDTGARRAELLPTLHRVAAGVTHTHTWSGRRRVTRALLTTLDDQLATVLERGDIALVRREWLLSQPDDFRMSSRQLLAGISFCYALKLPT